MIFPTPDEGVWQVELGYGTMDYVIVRYYAWTGDEPIPEVEYYGMPWTTP